MPIKHFGVHILERGSSIHAATSSRSVVAHIPRIGIFLVWDRLVRFSRSAWFLDLIGDTRDERSAHWPRPDPPRIPPTASQDGSRPLPRAVGLRDVLGGSTITPTRRGKSGRAHISAAYHRAAYKGVLTGGKCSKSLQLGDVYAVECLVAIPTAIALEPLATDWGIARAAAEGSVRRPS